MAILSGLDILPVQRNAGIDALLKRNYLSKPVPIRVQREHETLLDAATKLSAAAKKKGAEIAFLVATNQSQDLLDFRFENCIIKIINSPALEINVIFNDRRANKSLNTDVLTRAG